VLIATPNHLHATQAIAAMRAGKAVLCEKPMANTIEDAREMVRVAQETGAFFQIGFELRCSKLYVMAKEKIDSGELGQVRHIHCIYTLSPSFKRTSWRVKADTGGDMFGEKLSHYVDLPRWWNGGKVVEVYATKAPNVVPYYEIADNYEAIYTFDNGTVSHLIFMHHSAETPFDENDDLTDISEQAEGGHNLKYIIVGTKGVCELSVFDRAFKFYRFRLDEDMMRTKLVETHRWEKEEDHLYFHNGLDEYLDAARRVALGEPPFIAPEDGLATTELCFEIEAQAQRRCPT
jgi:predicted dehydrogenase